VIDTTLSNKTKQRLIQLKKKYHDLMYSSHKGGAGGIWNSHQYKEYKKLYSAIKKELNNI
jgi:hypothetical protein